MTTAGAAAYLTSRQKQETGEPALGAPGPLWRGALPATFRRVRRGQVPQGIRMSRRTNRTLLIAGACVLLLLFIGVTGIGIFGSFSICTVCGALQDHFAVRAPFVQVDIIPFTHVSETPLSEELRRLGLVGQHQHQWAFGYGSGNGILCSIGPGRHYRVTAQTEGVVRLFAACQQYNETELLNQLLKSAFDRDWTHQVRSAGQFMPEEGFTDSAAFLAWRDKELACLDLGWTSPPAWFVLEAGRRR